MDNKIFEHISNLSIYVRYFSARKVTGYGLEDRGSIPSHSVQTDSGVHAAFYIKGTVLLHGVVLKPYFSQQQRS
jgi:hypothetical protein